MQSIVLYLQFLCDINDFGTVKKSIEEHGLQVVSAYLGYIPSSHVDTPEDNIDSICDMIDRLESMEEVVRVYDNFRLPS